MNKIKYIKTNHSLEFFASIINVPTILFKKTFINSSKKWLKFAINKKKINNYTILFVFGKAYSRKFSKKFLREWFAGSKYRIIFLIS